MNGDMVDRVNVAICVICKFDEFPFGIVISVLK